ncbi:CsbD family protein [Oscillatoria amoena NRMC-F 0135]|nr:CsbD family protein [Geitlerinema splendidum]MDL5044708.1 CsbD family protein [Oscillatoria amoena NRMC-F 0135]
MSIENRAEATAKNIEGKLQEAVGEVTGNRRDKAEGKIKQAEAQALHTKENIKDSIKDEIDRA